MRAFESSRGDSIPSNMDNKRNRGCGANETKGSVHCFTLTSLPDNTCAVELKGRERKKRRRKKKNQFSRAVE